MLYCLYSTLYYSLLYSAVLFYTILYYTILYHTIPYPILLNCETFDDVQQSNGISFWTCFPFPVVAVGLWSAPNSGAFVEPSPRACGIARGTAQLVTHNGDMKCDS